jgi:hypothetical protein
LRRRSTPAFGHADAIPIAGELIPYLKAAINSSPSDLVFFDTDGSMLSRHTPFEEVLRRALAHAGIVTAYVHVCRKKVCSHAETAQDVQLRHCPVHGMKLWPRLRFGRFGSTICATRPARCC